MEGCYDMAELFPVSAGGDSDSDAMPFLCLNLLR